jgi:hypothetical protein
VPSPGGGTTVTVTGTNLANAGAVKFGTKSATITANTATSVGEPFKASLSATSGAGAGKNSISITGLSTASAVHFAPNSAVLTVVSGSLFNVTVPAGTAGPAGGSVATAGGTDHGFTYTYVDLPAVITVAPDSGGITTVTGGFTYVAGPGI